MFNNKNVFNFVETFKIAKTFVVCSWSLVLVLFRISFMTWASPLVPICKTFSKLNPSYTTAFPGSNLFQIICRFRFVGFKFACRFRFVIFRVWYWDFSWIEFRIYVFQAVVYGTVFNNPGGSPRALSPGYSFAFFIFAEEAQYNLVRNVQN